MLLLFNRKMGNLQVKYKLVRELLQRKKRVQIEKNREIN